MPYQDRIGPMPSTPNIPDDFDPQEYLLANPDVRAAGVDPVRHYLVFGIGEGRRYRREPAKPSSRMVLAAPSPQNVVDIFAGEWSSSFPPSSGLVSTGQAPLFEDGRLDFLEQALGPVSGCDVLEIGPLEAAHTYMLHRRGANSIVSVETNERAFLKCLCVKEIFELDRAAFRLGDAVAMLEAEETRYDLILASGVLYHMTEPLRFLRAVAARTDRLLLWTHYFDAEVIGRRDDADLFEPARALDGDPRYRGSKRRYPSEALAWSGFSGGVEAHAVWLEKTAILGFLEASGLTRISTTADAPDHQNGPAITIAAQRP